MNSSKELGGIKSLPVEFDGSTVKSKTWPRRSPLSPTVMAGVMAGVIFGIELGIMAMIHILPQLSPVVEALVDSTSLLLCLIPLYLFFYRPFWYEHQQFSREVSTLSRKLMTSVEEERKRVSHDLHDQCGQTLTALQLHLEVLRKSLPQGKSQHHEQVGVMEDLISQLNTELREVTYKLRPETLDQLGLVSALQTLTEDFVTLHPDMTIHEQYDFADRQGSKLGEAGELALYRICQECLHNIAKHAAAKTVSIFLQQQETKVLLKVEDDGEGFIVRRCHGGKRTGRQGIGLLGIRERVKDLGGEFNLSTQPGNGTTVIVLIPISSEETDGTSD